jgi:Novel STAND NTPase 1
MRPEPRYQRYAVVTTVVLDFIPAGRQCSLYSTRVNSFDRRNFYERLGGGVFLDDVKDWMRSEYDYILIDSRTGVSDTSGICTVKMPDTLVVFFTMNNQSIDGASAVVDSVFSQREDIRIFPILSRVDTFEIDRAEIRQKYAEQMFFRFPNGFREHERSEYWGKARIPYWAVFSYEEVLAIFRDPPQDPTRVLAGCERLTFYLTDRAIERLGEPPSEEKRQQVLADFAGPQGSGRPAIVSDSDTAERLLRTASETWRVLTPSERDRASRVFLRLVQSLDDGQTVLRNAPIEEFKDVGIIDSLAARSLVGRTKNPTTGREMLRLAHESLLRWPELMN